MIDPVETNDLVERAEAIIDRAVKRTPPGKGDSYVLTWEQAVAAVLDALAGIEALQARVAELEGDIKALHWAINDALHWIARCQVDRTEDVLRAALSPDHQEREKSDYCGHVEVNPDDFDISKLSPPFYRQPIRKDDDDE